MPYNYYISCLFFHGTIDEVKSKPATDNQSNSDNNNKVNSKAQQPQSSSASTTSSALVPSTSSSSTSPPPSLLPLPAFIRKYIMVGLEAVSRSKDTELPFQRQTRVIEVCPLSCFLYHCQCVSFIFITMLTPYLISPYYKLEV